MSDIAKNVAKALVEIGAVGFRPNDPITFVSGIISPIYIDNRTLPFHPAQWRVVLDGFVETAKNMNFEVVAGIEAAGIPHSATLGYLLNKPSVFVRKKPKDHGTKKMVEGGNVEGRGVLLVEDLVTLGGSSLKGVAEIRKAGGIVENVLVIVSFGLAEKEQSFEKEKVALHKLTTVPVILDTAVEMGRLSESDRKIVDEWYKEPWEWGR